MADEKKRKGVQEGRKADDPAVVPQNPTEDHGGGDTGLDEAVGDGPSGGAPADTSGSDAGSEAVGDGPSGGA
jgi:hypothetical protein